MYHILKLNTENLKKCVLKDESLICSVHDVRNSGEF